VTEEFLPLTGGVVTGSIFQNDDSDLQNQLVTK
jgi:hypothetical protein